MIQFRDYEISLLIRSCMKMKNTSKTKFDSLIYTNLMMKLQSYLNQME